MIYNIVPVIRTGMVDFLTTGLVSQLNEKDK
jgi:hypothetical protein